MTPYLPRIRFRLTRRMLAWNALLLAAGLLLLALGAEVYFRLTLPFVERSLPVAFVPDVGLLRRPNTEMRHTNNLDYWTIARRIRKSAATRANDSRKGAVRSILHPHRV